MTPHDAKEILRDTKKILRDKGLCGVKVGDAHVCILAIGHDGNMHDRGWVITTSDGQTVYHISNGHRTFKTHNQANAEWLCSTLNLLDLNLLGKE